MSYVLHESEGAGYATFHFAMRYVILILNMLCNITFCNEICHFDMARALHISIFDIEYAILPVNG